MQFKTKSVKLSDIAIDGGTHELLHSTLKYDATTGEFTRLVRTSSRSTVGQVIGRKDRHGHVRISFNGREYAAHRLAIFYTTGAWPDGEVDHRNGVRSDNRLSNIRVVSHRINLQNRHQAASHNKCGILGVTKRGGSFMARLKHDGKQIYLGSYASADEAHEVYLTAKRKIHEGCTL